jgi:hypothetical protein
MTLEDAVRDSSEGGDREITPVPDAAGAAVSALSRVPEWVVVTSFVVVVVVPLVAALVALSGVRWHPVLDMALTEMRVRDVGTAHTPMIGLPGRIGVAPDTGSHPGPLAFWLLAPAYRLYGQTSFALEIATVLVQVAVVAALVVCGFRLAGRAGIVAAAAVCAVVVRGYGMQVLFTPWNPWLPVLAWLLVMASTAAVLAGHMRWIVVVALAGSLAAQSHVSYALLSTCMFLTAAVGLIWQANRVESVPSPTGATPPRPTSVRYLGIGAAVAFVLWLPPLVQELGGGEGNLTRLWRHFSSAPAGQPVLGLADASKLLLRHLNVVDAFLAQTSGAGTFSDVSLDQGSAIAPGLLLLVAWLGSATVGAAVLRSRPLNSINIVIAVALVAGLVSSARIFGSIEYYLTLWAWGIAALMIATTIGSVMMLVHRRTTIPGSHLRTATVAAGVLLIAVATAATTIDAAHARHWEQDPYGERLAQLAPATRNALREGVGAAVGPDGRYLITSDDLYIDSYKYGLLNELDRAGLDVVTEAFFRELATRHRALTPSDVTTGPLDAEVRFASGTNLDACRRLRPDAVEVASIQPTDEERAQYDINRQVVLDEIDARLADGTLTRRRADQLRTALDDDVVRVQLFEPGFSDLARWSMYQMSLIGTEAAVLILPINPDAPDNECRFTPEPPQVDD